MVEIHPVSRVRRAMQLLGIIMWYTPVFEIWWLDCRTGQKTTEIVRLQKHLTKFSGSIRI